MSHIKVTTCYPFLFITAMSPFQEVVQQGTPALPSACSSQPNLLDLLLKLIPTTYFLQFIVCSCLPLIIFVSIWFIIFLITFALHMAIIFSSLSITSHISAPYITTGLKPTHNILNFSVDAFRDSVTGRRAK